MKPHTANWLELSAYDLDVARDLINSRRYVYAVFMCHLATEKLLKAAVVEFVGDDPPPRIHALKRLAEVARLELSDEQLTFLVELTLQQQGARYPADLRALAQVYTATYAAGTLRRSEEFRAWLEPQIKSAQQ